MQTKTQLLQTITQAIKKGTISPEEITSHLHNIHDFSFPSLNATDTTQSDNKSSSLFQNFHASPATMFYILGAVIVIIGIIIFVSQVWDNIGAPGRITTTLGIGLLLAALGSYLFNTKPQTELGSVFHFLGGILIPGGAMVTLNELSTGSSGYWPVAITFAVLFLMYYLLTITHKRPILTFFTIINTTIFFYALLAAILDNQLYLYDNVLNYFTILIAASYLTLAQSFKGTFNTKLSGLLNFFGSLGILSASFALTEDFTSQMIYFFIIFAGIYLSTKLHSRSLLIFSTLFLVFHIIQITSEYFADSLGWPISLIILGFIVIAVGYLSFNINKKYLKKSP